MCLPETVGLCFARLWYFFSVDKMSGAPVALDEAPGAGGVDGVPGVPEAVVFESDSRLVSGRLAVALDHDAVEAGITED